MLRFLANAFRTIAVLAVVGFAIALAPTVGNAFALSRTTPSKPALSQPVAEQSCAAFEAWVLDQGCNRGYVRKAAHTNHRPDLDGRMDVQIAGTGTSA
jgi:hypothetical protein